MTGGGLLNDKFFALPKEKQDRILNAALRSFGENGYKRSITDDIASSAGISKGLLFHYFHNKRELLQYVFDYSIRFIKQKMAGYNFQAEKDFFSLMIKTHLAKVEITRTYPYIFDFLMNIILRQDHEASEAVDVYNAEFLTNQKEGILRLIDRNMFKEGVVPEQVLDLTFWSAQGFMDMEFRPGEMDFEKLSEKYLVCLGMMRKQFYKEEYI
jgi:AcrR family transcriptional regulator